MSRILSLAFVTMALVSSVLGAGGQPHSLQAEQCYPFELGRVCLFDAATMVSETPFETETPTQTLTSAAPPTLTFTPTQTAPITSTNTPTRTPTLPPVPTVVCLARGENIVFFNDPGDYIHGPTISPTYAYPGSAASASTITFYGNLLHGNKVLFARFVLNWTPGSTTSATGVRLMRFPTAGGPQVMVTEFVQTGNSPVSNAAVITSSLQDAVDTSTDYFYGIQEKGNGTVGPLVYTAKIEVVWAGCP